MTSSVAIQTCYCLRYGINLWQNSYLGDISGFNNYYKIVVQDHIHVPKFWHMSSMYHQKVYITCDTFT